MPFFLNIAVAALMAFFVYSRVDDNDVLWAVGTFIAMIFIGPLLYDQFSHLFRLNSNTTTTTTRTGSTQATAPSIPTVEIV